MKTRRLSLLVFLVICVRQHALLQPRPEFDAALDSPVLMRILQTVDAATSDEHLFEVTLKLLKSICVCMHETLRVKEDRLGVSDANFVPNNNDPTNSNWKEVELYKKIYNDTCFDLREELMKKLNNSQNVIRNDEETILKANCAKKLELTTESIVLASTHSHPILQDDIKPHLEDILYRALIETEKYHEYSIKRDSLFNKSIPHINYNPKHSVIVILTLIPDKARQTNTEAVNDYLPITKAEINETLHTKSHIDIHILDTKLDPRRKDSEEHIDSESIPECQLRSLYAFLVQSENDNSTKAFKLLRKNNTIKVYIEVVVNSNHKDYCKICCKNETMIPLCTKNLIREKKVKTKNNALVKDHKSFKNYKETVSRIKSLVKMYGKRLKERKHDKQNSNECIGSPSLNIFNSADIEHGVINPAKCFTKDKSQFVNKEVKATTQILNPSEIIKEIEKDNGINYDESSKENTIELTSTIQNFQTTITKTPIFPVNRDKGVTSRLQLSDEYSEEKDSESEENATLTSITNASQFTLGEINKVEKTISKDVSTMSTKAVPDLITTERSEVKNNSEEKFNDVFNHDVSVQVDLHRGNHIPINDVKTQIREKSDYPAITTQKSKLMLENNRFNPENNIKTTETLLTKFSEKNDKNVTNNLSLFSYYTTFLPENSTSVTAMENEKSKEKSLQFNSKTKLPKDDLPYGINDTVTEIQNIYTELTKPPSMFVSRDRSVEIRQKLTDNNFEEYKNTIKTDGDPENNRTTTFSFSDQMTLSEISSFAAQDKSNAPNVTDAMGKNGIISKRLGMNTPKSNMNIQDHTSDIPSMHYTTVFHLIKEPKEVINEKIINKENIGTLLSPEASLEKSNILNSSTEIKHTNESDDASSITNMDFIQDSYLPLDLKIEKNMLYTSETNTEGISIKPNISLSPIAEKVQNKNDYTEKEKSQIKHTLTTLDVSTPKPTNRKETLLEAGFYRNHLNTDNNMYLSTKPVSLIDFKQKKTEHTERNNKKQIKTLKTVDTLTSDRTITPNNDYTHSFTHVPKLNRDETTYGKSVSDSDFKSSTETFFSSTKPSYDKVKYNITNTQKKSTEQIWTSASMTKSNTLNTTTEITDFNKQEDESNIENINLLKGSSLFVDSDDENINTERGDQKQILTFSKFKMLKTTEKNKAYDKQTDEYNIENIKGSKLFVDSDDENNINIEKTNQKRILSFSTPDLSMSTLEMSKTTAKLNVNEKQEDDYNIDNIDLLKGSNLFADLDDENIINTERGKYKTNVTKLLKGSNLFADSDDEFDINIEINKQKKPSPNFEETSEKMHLLTGSHLFADSENENIITERNSYERIGKVTKRNTSIQNTTAEMKAYDKQDENSSNENTHLSRGENNFYKQSFSTPYKPLNTEQEITKSNEKNTSRIPGLTNTERNHLGHIWTVSQLNSNKTTSKSRANPNHHHFNNDEVKLSIEAQTEEGNVEDFITKNTVTCNEEELHITPKAKNNLAETTSTWKTHLKQENIFMIDKTTLQAKSNSNYLDTNTESSYSSVTPMFTTPDSQLNGHNTNTMRSNEAHNSDLFTTETAYEETPSIFKENNEENNKNLQNVFKSSNEITQTDTSNKEPSLFTALGSITIITTSDSQIYENYSPKDENVPLNNGSNVNEDFEMNEKIVTQSSLPSASAIGTVDVDKSVTTNTLNSTLLVNTNKDQELNRSVLGKPESISHNNDEINKDNESVNQKNLGLHNLTLVGSSETTDFLAFDKNALALRSTTVAYAERHETSPINIKVLKELPKSHKISEGTTIKTENKTENVMNNTENFYLNGSHSDNDSKYMANMILTTYPPVNRHRDDNIDHKTEINLLHKEMQRPKINLKTEEQFYSPTMFRAELHEEIFKKAAAPQKDMIDVTLSPVNKINMIEGTSSTGNSLPTTVGLTYFDQISNKLLEKESYQHSVIMTTPGFVNEIKDRHQTDHEVETKNVTPNFNYFPSNFKENKDNLNSSENAFAVNTNDVTSFHRLTESGAYSSGTAAFSQFTSFTILSETENVNKIAANKVNTPENEHLKNIETVLAIADRQQQITETNFPSPETHEIISKLHSELDDTETTKMLIKNDANINAQFNENFLSDIIKPAVLEMSQNENVINRDSTKSLNLKNNNTAYETLNLEPDSVSITKDPFTKPNFYPKFTTENVETTETTKYSVIQSNKTQNKENTVTEHLGCVDCGLTIEDKLFLETVTAKYSELYSDFTPSIYENTENTEKINIPKPRNISTVYENNNTLPVSEDILVPDIKEAKNKIYSRTTSVSKSYLSDIAHNPIKILQLNQSDILRSIAKSNQIDVENDTSFYYDDSNNKTIEDDDLHTENQNNIKPSTKDNTSEKIVATETELNLINVKNIKPQSNKIIKESNLKQSVSEIVTERNLRTLRIKTTEEEEFTDNTNLTSKTARVRGLNDIFEFIDNITMKEPINEIFETIPSSSTVIRKEPVNLSLTSIYQEDKVSNMKKLLSKTTHLAKQHTMTTEGVTNEDSTRNHNELTSKMTDVNRQNIITYPLLDEVASKEENNEISEATPTNTTVITKEPVNLSLTTSDSYRQAIHLANNYVMKVDSVTNDESLGTNKLTSQLVNATRFKNIPVTILDNVTPKEEINEIFQTSPMTPHGSKNGPINLSHSTSISQDFKINNYSSSFPEDNFVHTVQINKNDLKITTFASSTKFVKAQKKITKSHKHKKKKKKKKSREKINKMNTNSQNTSKTTYNAKDDVATTSSSQNLSRVTYHKGSNEIINTTYKKDEKYTKTSSLGTTTARILQEDKNAPVLDDDIKLTTNKIVQIQTKKISSNEIDQTTPDSQNQTKPKSKRIHQDNPYYVDRLFKEVIIAKNNKSKDLQVFDKIKHKIIEYKNKTASLTTEMYALESTKIPKNQEFISGSKAASRSQYLKANSLTYRRSDERIMFDQNTNYKTEIVKSTTLPQGIERLNKDSVSVSTENNVKDHTINTPSTEISSSFVNKYSNFESPLLNMNTTNDLTYDDRDITTEKKYAENPPNNYMKYRLFEESLRRDIFNDSLPHSPEEIGSGTKTENIGLKNMVTYFTEAGKNLEVTTINYDTKSVQTGTMPIVTEKTYSNVDTLANTNSISYNLNYTDKFMTYYKQNNSEKDNGLEIITKSPIKTNEVTQMILNSPVTQTKIEEKNNNDPSNKSLKTIDILFDLERSKDIISTTELMPRRTISEYKNNAIHDFSKKIQNAYVLGSSEGLMYNPSLQTTTNVPSVTKQKFQQNIQTESTQISEKYTTESEEKFHNNIPILISAELSTNQLSKYLRTMQTSKNTQDNSMVTEPFDLRISTQMKDTTVNIKNIVPVEENDINNQINETTTFTHQPFVVSETKGIKNEIMNKYSKQSKYPITSEKEPVTMLNTFELRKMPVSNASNTINNLLVTKQNASGKEINKNTPMSISAELNDNQLLKNLKMIQTSKVESTVTEPFDLQINNEIAQLPIKFKSQVKESNLILDNSVPVGKAEEDNQIYETTTLTPLPFVVSETTEINNKIISPYSVQTKYPNSQNKHVTMSNNFEITKVPSSISTKIIEDLPKNTQNASEEHLNKNAPISISAELNNNQLLKYLKTMQTSKVEKMVTDPFDLRLKNKTAPTPTKLKTQLKVSNTIFDNSVPVGNANEENQIYKTTTLTPSLFVVSETTEINNKIISPYSVQTKYPTSQNKHVTMSNNFDITKVTSSISTKIIEDLPKNTQNASEEHLNKNAPISISAELNNNQLLKYLKTMQTSKFEKMVTDPFYLRLNNKTTPIPTKLKTQLKVSNTIFDNSVPVGNAEEENQIYKPTTFTPSPFVVSETTGINNKIITPYLVETKYSTTSHNKHVTMSNNLNFTKITSSISTNIIEAFPKITQNASEEQLNKNTPISVSAELNNNQLLKYFKTMQTSKVIQGETMVTETLDLQIHNNTAQTQTKIRTQVKDKNSVSVGKIDMNNQKNETKNLMHQPIVISETNSINDERKNKYSTQLNYTKISEEEPVTMLNSIDFTKKQFSSATKTIKNLAEITQDSSEDELKKKNPISISADFNKNQLLKYLKTMQTSKVEPILTDLLDLRINNETARIPTKLKPRVKESNDIFNNSLKLGKIETDNEIYETPKFTPLPLVVSESEEGLNKNTPISISAELKNNNLLKVLKTMQTSKVIQGKTMVTEPFGLQINNYTAQSQKKFKTLVRATTKEITNSVPVGKTDVNNEMHETTTFTHKPLVLSETNENRKEIIKHSTQSNHPKIYETEPVTMFSLPELTKIPLLTVSKMTKNLSEITQDASEGKLNRNTPISISAELNNNQLLKYLKTMQTSKDMTEPFDLRINKKISRILSKIQEKQTNDKNNVSWTKIDINNQIHKVTNNFPFTKLPSSTSTKIIENLSEITQDVQNYKDSVTSSYSFTKLTTPVTPGFHLQQYEHTEQSVTEIPNNKLKESLLQKITSIGDKHIVNITTSPHDLVTETSIAYLESTAHLTTTSNQNEFFNPKKIQTNTPLIKKHRHNIVYNTYEPTLEEDIDIEISTLKMLVKNPNQYKTQKIKTGKGEYEKKNKKEYSLSYEMKNITTPKNTKRIKDNELKSSVSNPRKTIQDLIVTKNKTFTLNSTATSTVKVSTLNSYVDNKNITSQSIENHTEPSMKSQNITDKLTITSNTMGPIIDSYGTKIPKYTWKKVTPLIELTNDFFFNITKHNHDQNTQNAPFKFNIESNTTGHMQNFYSTITPRQKWKKVTPLIELNSDFFTNITKQNREKSSQFGLLDTENTIKTTLTNAYSVKFNNHLTTIIPFKNNQTRPKGFLKNGRTETTKQINISTNHSQKKKVRKESKKHDEVTTQSTIATNTVSVHTLSNDINNITSQPGHNYQKMTTMNSKDNENKFNAKNDATKYNRLVINSTKIPTLTLKKITPLIEMKNDFITNIIKQNYAKNGKNESLDGEHFNYTILTTEHIVNSTDFEITTNNLAQDMTGNKESMKHETTKTTDRSLIATKQTQIKEIRKETKKYHKITTEVTPKKYKKTKVKDKIKINSSNNNLTHIEENKRQTAKSSPVSELVEQLLRGFYKPGVNKTTKISSTTESLKHSIPKTTIPRHWTPKWNQAIKANIKLSEKSLDGKSNLNKPWNKHPKIDKIKPKNFTTESEVIRQLLGRFYKTGQKNKPFNSKTDNGYNSNSMFKDWNLDNGRATTSITLNRNFAFNIQSNNKNNIKKIMDPYESSVINIMNHNFEPRIDHMPKYKNYYVNPYSVITPTPSKDLDINVNELNTVKKLVVPPNVMYQNFGNKVKKQKILSHEYLDYEFNFKDNFKKDALITRSTISNFKSKVTTVSSITESLNKIESFKYAMPEFENLFIESTTTKSKVNKYFNSGREKLTLPPYNYFENQYVGVQKNSAILKNYTKPLRKDTPKSKFIYRNTEITNKLPISKTLSNNDQLLDPFDKNYYSINRPPHTNHWNMPLMKKVSLNNPKQMLAMNTNDFFSQRKQQSLSSKEHKIVEPMPVILNQMLRPESKQKMLRPKFKGIENKMPISEPIPYFISPSRSRKTGDLDIPSKNKPDSLSWKDRASKLHEKLHDDEELILSAEIPFTESVLDKSLFKPLSPKLKGNIENFNMKSLVRPTLGSRDPKKYFFAAPVEVVTRKESLLEPVLMFYRKPLRTLDRNETTQRPMVTVTPKPKPTRRSPRTIFFLSPTVGYNIHYF